MRQCYRTFTLQSLRTGSLAIAEKIAEHKALLQAAEATIQRSIGRLVLSWAVGTSLFAGLFSGIVFFNIYIGLAAFVLFAVLAISVSRLPVLRVRLLASGRYSDQLRQIEQSKAAIEELHQKARNYQLHLEMPGGPGFLACFADVLLHGHYPSFFPLEDRIRFVDLSTEGRGAQIDIFDYGRLVLELRGCEIADYIDPDSLASRVPPQNKHNVAIAYAELIARDTGKANEDAIRFAALVGLNAWLAFESQGHPLTWTSHETGQWSLVRKIFQGAMARNVVTLAKALSEFNELERKHAKRVLQGSDE